MLQSFLEPRSELAQYRIHLGTNTLQTHTREAALKQHHLTSVGLEQARGSASSRQRSPLTVQLGVRCRTRPDPFMEISGVRSPAPWAIEVTEGNSVLTPVDWCSGRTPKVVEQSY